MLHSDLLLRKGVTSRPCCLTFAAARTARELLNLLPSLAAHRPWAMIRPTHLQAWQVPGRPWQALQGLGLTGWPTWRQPGLRRQRCALPCPQRSRQSCSIRGLLLPLGSGSLGSMRPGQPRLKKAARGA